MLAVCRICFLSLKYHGKEILLCYYYFLLHLILKAGGGQGNLQSLYQIYSTYVKFKAPQEAPF